MSCRTRFRLSFSLKATLMVGAFFWVLNGDAQTTASSGTQAISRDPAAVQILLTALNGLGGQAAWQSVHAAQVVGTATYLAKSESGFAMTTSPIIWVDDWSTGHPRYRRTTANSSGQQNTHLADGSATFTATYQGKSISVPQQDTATILLTHLPGAALNRELSDQSYGIEVFKPTGNPFSTSPSTVGLTIVRITASDHRTIQDWSISNQTGLPQSVRFTVPDVITPTRKAWEVITYTHFQSYGELLVPDSAMLIRANHQTLTFQFTSLAINPSVQDKDFQVGGNQ